MDVVSCVEFKDKVNISVIVQNHNLDSQNWILKRNKIGKGLERQERDEVYMFYKEHTYNFVSTLKLTMLCFFRIHYRLFYALYLFENASSTSLGDLQSAIINKKGQQSLMKYRYSVSSCKLTQTEETKGKKQT